jgi:hypothetical protein
VLGTTAQLASVVAVAAACDIARDDAGLIAAVLMGLAVANMRGFDIPARRPFFETLVQLIIGVLFISISATVTPKSVHHLLLPALGLVAVLVLVEVVMWAASEDQREQVKLAGLELAPGELLASAAGRGAELEGITAVLLLTDEDDFNALASTVLAGNLETEVYRLAPRQPSHGVVAPTPAGKPCSPPPSPATTSPCVTTLAPAPSPPLPTVESRREPTCCSS